MTSSNPSLADWRARVEKELAGAPFDRLVTRTPEGAIQPLYVDPIHTPPPGVAPFVRGASAAPPPFAICMRAAPDAPDAPDALGDDLAGGADALWLRHDDRAALEAALGHGLGVVIDAEGVPERDAALDLARFAWLGLDPLDEVWRGVLAPRALAGRLRELGAFAAASPRVRSIRVSSLAYHRAGADAVDEVALVLATAAAYLRGLDQHGLAVADAARAMWAQVAVGRDTFGELCKLRALRLVWWKLFAAAGVTDAALELHAVCAPRTQARRDPWVNLLRVTTEVFAAVLGGAQVVTPAAFDEAYGPASPLGRRTARNTALVLREESHLGRVLDAGGGSYYLEARTDALARAAWARFTAIEREGGLVARLPTIRDQLAEAWRVRAAAIARRKEPVLGVSEFANLGETLPAPASAPVTDAGHRDGEAFEAARARLEGSREVVLVTLGPPAEHRARVGYAQAFFATAGLATRERAWPPSESAPLAPAGAYAIACLCGGDDRYASEAIPAAATLRAAGYRVVLAGRPGALEPALTAAEVTCIFIGCDVIATLEELAP